MEVNIIMRDTEKSIKFICFFYQYKFLHCKLDTINKTDGCFDVTGLNTNCKSAHTMGVLSENKGFCD